MRIESKTVREDAHVYINFGWQHTEDVRKGSGPRKHTEHVLVRDLDMPNYDEIKELENEYLTLKSQIQRYEPIDPTIGFLLFVLLMFPFFIYYGFKKKQKEEINDHNTKIKIKMAHILKSAKELIK